MNLQIVSRLNKNKNNTASLQENYHETLNFPLNPYTPNKVERKSINAL